jgi:hypothetical protein
MGRGALSCLRLSVLRPPLLRAACARLRTRCAALLKLRTQLQLA